MRNNRNYKQRQRIQSQARKGDRTLRRPDPSPGTRGQCLADLGSGNNGLCNGITPCSTITSAWSCEQCWGCCWDPDGMGCAHQPMHSNVDSETLGGTVTCSCYAWGGGMSGGFQSAYCGIYSSQYQCCNDLEEQQCGPLPACYANPGAEPCPPGANDECNSHTFNCYEPG